MKTTPGLKADPEHGFSMVTVKGFCESADIKLKHVAQPSRVALTGEVTGPGLFEMMVVLGRASVLNRLHRACGGE